MANKFETILQSLETERKPEFRAIAWLDAYAVVKVFSHHKTHREAWKEVDRLNGEPLSKSEERTEYYNKKLASGE